MRAVIPTLHQAHEIIQERCHAIYISRGCFTSAAVKGMLAKPENREEAVAKLFKSVGGRLIGWYLTFGHHDWMAIGEFPDELAAFRARDLSLSNAKFVLGAIRARLSLPAKIRFPERHPLSNCQSIPKQFVRSVSGRNHTAKPPADSAAVGGLASSPRQRRKPASSGLSDWGEKQWEKPPSSTMKVYARARSLSAPFYSPASNANSRD
jgi:uncharacterized protein with GYD domain